eukprot:3321410-Ditylum_brightwellii.AAC.1
MDAEMEEATPVSSSANSDLPKGGEAASRTRIPSGFIVVFLFLIFSYLHAAWPQPGPPRP